MKMRLANKQRNGFRPHPRAGMTLVEVVIALAIAALLIGGIVTGYNYCTQASRKTALALTASAMAMQRMEEARSVTWDTAAIPPVDQLTETNFPSRDVTLDVAGSGVTISEATVYTYISQISTNPPLKRIRVDCVWDYNGQPITNAIETIRAPKQ